MRLDGGVSHTRAPCGPPIWSTYRPTATSAVIAPYSERLSDVMAQIIAGTKKEIAKARVSPEA
jgi:hypothetical protein